MKKLLSLAAVACTFLMVACGNAEVDKINALVVEATEKTKAATSTQEVADIATNLQQEMDEIAAQAGEKFTIGKDVEAALKEYQSAAAAKLSEFGIELQ